MKKLIILLSAVCSSAVYAQDQNKVLRLQPIYENGKLEKFLALTYKSKKVLGQDHFLELLNPELSSTKSQALVKQTYSLDDKFLYFNGTTVCFRTNNADNEDIDLYTYSLIDLSPKGTVHVKAGGMWAGYKQVHANADGYLVEDGAKEDKVQKMHLVMFDNALTQKWDIKTTLDIPEHNVSSVSMYSSFFGNEKLIPLSFIAKSKSKPITVNSGYGVLNPEDGSVVFKNATVGIPDFFSRISTGDYLVADAQDSSKKVNLTKYESKTGKLLSTKAFSLSSSEALSLLKAEVKKDFTNPNVGLEVASVHEGANALFVIGQILEKNQNNKDKAGINGHVFILEMTKDLNVTKIFTFKRSSLNVQSKSFKIKFWKDSKNDQLFCISFIDLINEKNIRWTKVGYDGSNLSTSSREITLTYNLNPSRDLVEVYEGANGKNIVLTELRTTSMDAGSNRSTNAEVIVEQK